jgi:hypothetical protein
MRRICIAGIVTALPLAFATWATIQLWDREPIHYDNFDKIETGMTKGEVEGLLGCTSGNYSKKQPSKIGFAGIVPGWERHEWIGDYANVLITFRDGCAAERWMIVHPQWIELAGVKFQWRSGSEVFRRV